MKAGQTRTQSCGVGGILLCHVKDLPGLPSMEGGGLRVVAEEWSPGLSRTLIGASHSGQETM